MSAMTTSKSITPLLVTSRPHSARLDNHATDALAGDRDALPRWATQILDRGKEAIHPDTALWPGHSLARILGEIHAYSRQQEKAIEGSAEEIAKRRRPKIMRKDGSQVYLCAKCRSGNDALCDICNKKLEHQRFRSDRSRAVRKLRTRCGSEAPWDFTLLKLRTLYRYELPIDREIMEYVGQAYLGGDSEEFKEIASKIDKADTDDLRSTLFRSLLDAAERRPLLELQTVRTGKNKRQLVAKVSPRAEAKAKADRKGTSPCIPHCVFHWTSPE